MGKTFFLWNFLPINKSKINNINDIIFYIGTNVGNSYPPYSMLKHMYGDFIKHKTGWLSAISEDTNIDELLEEINSYDNVVLFLQDFVRPKEYDYSAMFDRKKIKFIDFLKRINVPIIVPAMGINCITHEYNSDFYKRVRPELVDVLRVISEKTNYIGLRGEYSQEMFSKLGINNTIITGCPTYFENGKNRVITKNENIKYKDIVLINNFENKYLKRNDVILQGYGLTDKHILNFLSNPNTANAKINDIIRQFNTNFYILPNILEWKNIVKQYKCSMGSRVHGSIMTLNQGLTPVIIYNDIRAKEMLNYFKLPYFSMERIKENPLKLLEEVDFAEANKVYNKLYDNYIDFLRKNNLQVYDETTDLKIDKEEIITELPTVYKGKPVKIMRNLFWRNCHRSINIIQNML